MNTSPSTTSKNALPTGDAARRAMILAGAWLLAVSSILAQVPCEDGMAGQYPCEGIDLMSVRSFEELGGVPPGNGNDCWGWTSEGREFVLFGRSDGTSIVEITDPVNPTMIANVPTSSVPSLWRDIKVIGDVAYIVSEAGEHGMQVVDLTQVPAMEPMSSLGTLAFYTGFGSAHNVAANPQTDFVYGVGTDTFNGGLHIVDVSDPSNPTLAGAWDEFYVHDAQIVVYTGPDADHNGKEIAFAFSGFSGCHIVDVEDKTDCQTLSSLTGPEFVYPHQGWLTEDQRFVLMNDEMDEAAGIAQQTRTWILDVQDLDNPFIVGFHEGSLAVTDHNLYTHQGFVYEANYFAGLQVLAIGDTSAPSLEEIAYFDTNPFSNQTGTGGGAWNVYPYFESGNIAISTQSHLFVVRASEPFSHVGEVAPEPGLSLHCSDGVVRLTSGAAVQERCYVFDAMGRQQAEWMSFPGVTTNWFVSDWPKGVYVVRTESGGQGRFSLN